MARKDTPTPQPMVLLEFQYQKFVMPMEQGLALFQAMADMRPVEYSYDHKAYRYSAPGTSNGQPPSLRIFTMVEQAQLALEGESPQE